MIGLCCASSVGDHCHADLGSALQWMVSLWPTARLLFQEAAYLRTCDICCCPRPPFCRVHSCLCLSRLCAAVDGEEAPKGKGKGKGKAAKKQREMPSEAEIEAAFRVLRPSGSGCIGPSDLYQVCIGQLCRLMRNAGQPKRLVCC